MKKSLSVNWIIFFFIGMAMLIVVMGVKLGILQITILGIVFFILMLWLQANLTSVAFDSELLFLTKRGQTIKVPIHRIEWVTELLGSGMSTCFMGFKSPTLFGSRIIFFSFSYGTSLEELVSISKSQGNEIEVRGWFS